MVTKNRTAAALTTLAEERSKEGGNHLKDINDVRNQQKGVFYLLTVNEFDFICIIVHQSDHG